MPRLGVTIVNRSPIVATTRMAQAPAGPCVRPRNPVDNCPQLTVSLSDFSRALAVCRDGAGRPGRGSRRPPWTTSASSGRRGCGTAAERLPTDRARPDRAGASTPRTEPSRPTRPPSGPLNGVLVVDLTAPPPRLAANRGLFAVAGPRMRANSPRFAPGGPGTKVGCEPDRSGVTGVMSEVERPVAGAGGLRGARAGGRAGARPARAAAPGPSGGRARRARRRVGIQCSPGPWRAGVARNVQSPATPRAGLSGRRPLDEAGRVLGDGLLAWPSVRPDALGWKVLRSRHGERCALDA